MSEANAKSHVVGAGKDRPDPTPDEALVRASQRGDARAFAALVERHHGLVRALVARAGTRPSEAEDLAQEAWLAAWRGLSSLREPARFTGWLAALAVNTGRLSARRGRVEAGARPLLERRAREREGVVGALAPGGSPCSGGAGPGSSGGSPDPLVLEEERRAVLAALDGLPEEARALVLERYVEGRSAPEIASSLGVAADAVRQRLARALRALRERLPGLVEGGTARSGART